LLNIAACNLKLKEYDVAILACDEALTIDPKNVKALYRKARAHILPINAGKKFNNSYFSGVDDLETSLKSLTMAIEFEPDNHIVEKEI
jgi:tetratricopeptide (TPR) repeat protein